MEQTSILVVDDRPENLLAMEKILNAPDLKIVTATSGNQALGLTLDHDFALVLLDVQMPDMDGYETAELMRGNEDTRHIPIIFVTAINTDQAHVFKGYESGAVDYMFKPFDADILVSKVRIFLDLHRQKAALQRINDELERANRKILDQQKAMIEEERLKVLLQMAGATAHELNQPVMALLGTIELMEMSGPLPENLARHINRIKEASRRISGTVRKIQMVRRPETTIHDADTEMINLDQKIRILCVEAAEKDYSRMRKLLGDESHLQLSRAATITEAVTALKRHPLDLIFLEHILPDGTGFDFLQQMEQERIEVPVVMITAHGDAVFAAQIVQSGAYDYLPKRQLGRDALLRIIGNTLEKARLKTDVKRAQQKLLDMCTKDELTGIYNRRFFDEAMDREFVRAERYSVNYSLALLDLDFFKSINERCGYTTGDALLKETAALMIATFRRSDLACRYSGETFAVILPHTGLDDAVNACELFRQQLADRQLCQGTVSVRLTVSIGVTTFDCSRAKSPEKLLRQAAEALARAKGAGRNQTAVYGVD